MDQSDAPEILGGRKADHIDLCHEADVEARERRTLLDDVHLMHDSLPELALDDLDLSTTFAGLHIPVPIMVSGMTGGIARAGDINRTIARVAEEYGMAMGVGSQRAMMRDPAVADTFRIREVAPSIPIFGNIGAVQAAEMSLAELEDLVGAIDADALCIHLNPGQELVQDHGDRDFRGCLDGIARAVDGLSVPIIAKETGCGLSPGTLRRLQTIGINAVDVSGVGGTTWVGVEALRGRGVRKAVGDALWDWGVPTAASVHYAASAQLEVIASGGIRNGRQAANALALGASLASSALPWLRAAIDGGEDGVRHVAEVFLETLRAVMLLTGSGTLAELRRAPRLIGPELQRWMDVG